MINIGIVGGTESLQTKNILLQLYTLARKEVSISTLNTDGYTGPYHILIVNDYSRMLPECVHRLGKNTAIIANGDQSSIQSHLKGIHQALLTYGFNQKASLTASSVSQEDQDNMEHQIVQCCIQRKFHSRQGHPLDQQEFSIEIQNGHRNIYSILAAVATALLDDIFIPV